MDFLTSTILSGILYDLIKKGVQLSFKNVFLNFYSKDLDYNICEEFLNQINLVKDQNEKLLYSNKILSEENKYTIMFEKNMYTTTFAKRLDYIFMQMNDCGYWGQKINVEKAGEFLGFKSVNTLKKYYLYTEEPDYDFIENVSEKLGINSKWMKFGFGEPFESPLPRLHRAHQILEQEDFNDIKEFIFVIEDEIYRRNIGVILKLSDYKYMYYPYTFVFHADVGAGGASELFSVYLFLKKLDNKKLLPSGVYKVSSEEFSKLFHGKVYPASIKKHEMNESIYLLDDFLDLYNTEEKKRDYIKCYGRVFVDSQDIIKARLESV